jgi:hypothetical protein
LRLKALQAISGRAVPLSAEAPDDAHEARPPGRLQVGQEIELVPGRRPGFKSMLFRGWS